MFTLVYSSICMRNIIDIPAPIGKKNYVYKQIISRCTG